MSSKNSCPVCGTHDISKFLTRENVPVQQNFLIDDKESAIGVIRGNLNLAVCRQCGFIFNHTFDLSKLSYANNYDNTQNHSPSFDNYISNHVSYLVSEKNIRNCSIIEVGCGKGTFLKKLIEVKEWRNTGYGFDPSYVGLDTEFEGRLKFEKRNYDLGCTNIRADIVICRHVIEHVPDPIKLLCTIKQALVKSPKAHVFFETPDVEWILRNHVIWDFFYEHCSYFSEQSLTTAFEVSGFTVESVRHVFGGQYLWLEAVVASTKPPIKKRAGCIPTLAKQFAESEQELKKNWEIKIRELASKGKAAVWGGGAKGVTFVNLVDPECKWIDSVIDLNPQKQGRYIPGTGHPIINYKEIVNREIKSAILMNPNYYEENMALLNKANLKVDLIK